MFRRIAVLSLGMLMAAMFTAVRADDTPTSPTVIAHRGASFLAPENTMAAFRLGWEQGADAVELDCYLTADGRVAIMHDKSAKRTTGVDLEVAKATADQLRALDAGSWKNPKYAGEKVPFLEEVVAAIPPAQQLVIEIKAGPETVAPVARIVDAHGRRRSVSVISFKKEVVLESKRVMPDVPAYWLLDAPKNKETDDYGPISPARAEEARMAGFDGISVSWRGADAELMAACRKAGIPLLVWTVDDPEVAKRLVAMGVSAVTTNKPDTMLAALGRSAKKSP